MYLREVGWPDIIASLLEHGRSGPVIGWMGESVCGGTVLVVRDVTCFSRLDHYAADNTPAGRLQTREVHTRSSGGRGIAIRFAVTGAISVMIDLLSQRGLVRFRNHNPDDTCRLLIMLHLHALTIQYERGRVKAGCGNLSPTREEEPLIHCLFSYYL